MLQCNYDIGTVSVNAERNNSSSKQTEIQQAVLVKASSVVSHACRPHVFGREVLA